MQMGKVVGECGTCMNFTKFTLSKTGGRPKHISHRPRKLHPFSSGSPHVFTAMAARARADPE